LKLIAPILKRAQELDAAKPKIAYYCRMHAVREGLKLDYRSAEVNEELSDAMERLERAKAKMKDELNEEHDELECESFALQIFVKADRADRGGSRGMNTAKMFYASSIFFNVLRQFDADGKLDADIENKQRYAEWRAAEITKACREGRNATAPPADDEGEERSEIGVEAEASSAEPEVELPPAPRHQPPPPPPPPPHVASGPPAGVNTGAPSKATSKTPVVRGGRAPPGVTPPKIDVGSIADAQRHAKNAVSALGFDDVNTAVEALERALNILGPLAAKK
jgi:vacuolar protein sorting-associated protein VTA1